MHDYMWRAVVAALIAANVHAGVATSRSLRHSLDAASPIIKTYNFTSVLPYTALDFFAIPFDVPAGTAEIQINHLQTAINTSNILDWGLFDTNGFRGWGGGNTETAIVGASASSRSYLITGAVQAGTWQVIVGKPRISVPPGSYSVNITLLSAPSLPAQLERQPYQQCAPLSTPAQLAWYAGDFHVHSRESGDAFMNATHDEIATFAASQHLDFVHFSEHNTVSTATFLVDAQSRHPNTLLLPGVEYTTYHGHAGAMFTTQFVDFRIGNPNVTIQGAADAIHAQGGLLTINHMDMYEGDSDGDLRNDCVGCFWDFAGALPGASVDAVEIAIQSWEGIGFMFSPEIVEWWDHQHALGFTHIAPVGGSDEHHGGQEETQVGNWEIGSPVGSPTTMVLAANLSHAAIREGVKLGRTAVKMFNALDPMVDLTAQMVSPSQGVVARLGGSVQPSGSAPKVQLNVTVTIPSNTTSSHARALKVAGPAAAGPWYVALVRNNEQTFVANVTQSPFYFSVEVPFPEGGTDRWRAEVHDQASGTLRTITNHIFLPSA